MEVRDNPVTICEEIEAEFEILTGSLDEKDMSALHYLMFNLRKSTDRAIGTPQVMGAEEIKFMVYRQAEDLEHLLRMMGANIEKTQAPEDDFPHYHIEFNKRK